MYTVTKEYHFSAAHRLEGHPKCGRLHGHNYRIVFTFGARHLRDGMVIDFGDINKIVKPYIEMLDHRYIVSIENRVRECPYQYIAPKSQRLDDLAHLDIARSTAELLAKWFADHVSEAIPTMEHWKLQEVVVWETPKAFAVYRYS